MRPNLGLGTAWSRSVVFQTQIYPCWLLASQGNFCLHSFLFQEIMLLHIYQNRLYAVQHLTFCWKHVARYFTYTKGCLDARQMGAIYKVYQFMSSALTNSPDRDITKVKGYIKPITENKFTKSFLQL